MLLTVTVVSSLIFTERRKAMQIFPESVRKVWNEWELRAMVLISLGLQIILILIGNWRKHSTSNVIRIVVWLAYLSADSVATVSLGILSSNQEHSLGNSVNPDYVITAFWAPFLLLHLGGPDTITAYSLEDNELWLRHLLGLVVQVLVAFYVLLRAWSTQALNFLAIPMFLVGIMKFGERTWVLRSASSEHFRESMLPNPDPGPNYARYMEEYSSKKAEGFRVESKTFIEAPIVGDDDYNVPHQVLHDRIISTQNAATNINKAYTFFESFKPLCADLILSFHDIETTQSFFQRRSSEEAFEVIEFELGFMYDVFYTKAVLVYSRVGFILRCITLCFTLCVFLAFLLVIDKQSYKKVDVFITYILLVGAIVLEFYALIIILSSDWTMLWLSKHKNMAVDMLRRTVSSIPLIENKRWSNTLSQYNLITYCLKERPPKCIFIPEDLFINRLLEKYRYTDLKDISKELKSLIFEQLMEKSRIAFNFEPSKRKQLCAQRGARVLDQAGCLDELGWTIDGAEFDQSILLWHVATDLCYYSDVNSNFVNRSRPNCEASRVLSNYMLYVLVMCPFMLPNGIGQIRFGDTCAEAEEFFTERKSISDAKKACTMLLKVCTDILPSKVKGDRSKSVLFDACRLAKALELLETEGHWDNNEKKWEFISHMWVEMLCYAAYQCRWRDHGQQLRRGGELLTHVWLLMAHLGLTEQFQISQGHVRAKLILH